MEGAKLKEIGVIIREKRIAAGFTQNGFAQILHITDKAVSKWERGIGFPDITLLPKIAVLLDIDMNLLVSERINRQDWVGVINIQESDLSQEVYDKPLVYYLLSHFLLLGITSIHILTSETNQVYLRGETFSNFGFNLCFTEPHNKKMMIIDKPWFLFGSDLTQLFQAAMMSKRSVALIPENQEPVFYFSDCDDEYFRNRERFVKTLTKRTLGRGMVCISADSQDNMADIASFVRTYQRSSGLLIGSLEEIAYRQGTIDYVKLRGLAEKVSYGNALLKLVN